MTSVRAPGARRGGWFDWLLVVAGAWLAGGLAAAAGASAGMRWLAAALVWPVVPLALAILVSPRLGLRRVALALTALEVGVCAAMWRPGLVAAVTTHAAWMLGASPPAETPVAPTPAPAPAPSLTPSPTPAPTPSPTPAPTPSPTPAPTPSPAPAPEVAAPSDAPGERGRCFREVVKTGLSASIYGTTLVDMDGDGQPDVVAIESADTAAIRVWKGDRDGRFHPAGTQAYGGGGLHLAVLDVDRDGKPDVATADHEQAKVTLWMGAGDGTLTRGASVSTYRSPIGIWAADLDVDGFSDLVVAHYFHVEVMRGGEGGKLRATPWLKLVKQADAPRTLLTPEGVAAADLTGDGLLDLVIPKGDVTSIEVWTGRPRGGFARAAAVESCFAPAAALVGDVDEDGAADVVVHCGQGHLELFAGDGRGGLADRGRVGPDWALNAGALVDLTGDGHLDLVSPVLPGEPSAGSAFGQRGALAVSAGDGGGKFRALELRALDGLQHRVVAVVDIDGDERLDVVYECFGQHPGAHVGVAFGTGCAG
jgi:hypothetical protein